MLKLCSARKHGWTTLPITLHQFGITITIIKCPLIWNINILVLSDYHKHKIAFFSLYSLFISPYKLYYYLTIADGRILIQYFCGSNVVNFMSISTLY